MELPVVHPLDLHYRDLDSTDGQLAILGHYLHLAFEAGLGGVQAAADFPVQEPAPGGPVREGPRIIRVIRITDGSAHCFAFATSRRPA